ncbi:hypothetical protein JQ604_16735 [Bradyrhizobium jicamae]|uniref:hypothetical protein n=1 Tax=Bradyrhizobium jicamae TaxID=280332 RepID=UPI001BA6758D|nr:hypothetical protein [Bradyrhizobium jicamae]MBR0753833.1 hypothetical protein [Bradyrhizobium jicamae]
MRKSIIVIVALLPAVAFAQQGTPKKTDTSPTIDKTLPLKGTARSNSCAEFGPGFVKVEGTGTCMKVGGGISVDAGARR